LEPNCEHRVCQRRVCFDREVARVHDHRRAVRTDERLSVPTIASSIALIASRSI
jgi:hypothetical protein